MKRLLAILTFLPFLAHSQAILTKWSFNSGGNTADYWSTTGSGMSVTYTFTNSTTLTDVTQMCYDNNYVYVKSQGVTDYMGKYLNPGTCTGQNYSHKLPRTPSVPTTKTISPKGGATGILLNGIPIFGLGNSTSWTGSANSNMGSGIWNTEVYISEGFTLDTAFAAHPQQQGAYHSHAAPPYRLYKYYASTVHSPIIGWAFDGNPVYGPYGYTTPLDGTSAITRMKTGYAKRNITVRTTLPSGATASQSGPSVNATYPIGTYCEDYAWSSANGGTLDEYNGRYCVTPEYPSGTYAYFVSISSAGVPEFPYIIGINYYGAPETTNFTSGGSTTNTVTVPSMGVTCVTSSAQLPLELIAFSGKIGKNQNNLTWQTASEQNINFFQIERSADGLNFETIGTTKSKGNARSLQNYAFTDAQPLPKSYYRLRSVENDGKEEFSKVITLINDPLTISVYPSRTSDLVQILLAPSVSKGEIEVFDLIGRAVLHECMATNEASISLGNLMSGIYMVSVRVNGVVHRVKVMKE